MLVCFSDGLKLKLYGAAAFREGKAVHTVKTVVGDPELAPVFALIR